MKLLLRGLERAPSAVMRQKSSALLRALLAWQRRLHRWPDVHVRAPDATAFVSVYVDGRLRGCFGFDDGKPGERIARAFLLAMNDSRFGGLAADNAAARKAKHVALVSYARSIAPVGIADAPKTIAPGIHGLFYVTDDARGAMLLPQVARDEHLDGGGLMCALAKKAGVAELAEGHLFVFEVEEVSSLVEQTKWRGEIDEAASFLDRTLERDSHVDFMIDARTGARTRAGEMHHGRAAVVVRALDAAGRRHAAARARRRLANDIGSASRGEAPAGWPTTRPMICGTLALAIRAGVEVADELERLAREESFDGAPWYAAQVVAALGERARPELYARCIADLAERPWAPWTMIAAVARGDRTTAKRCAVTLASSVRSKGAHEGGVGFGGVPELALTALTVEALLHDESRTSKRAVERARAFLRTWQNDPRRPRGPVDPSVARGGFPLSPNNDALRSDVTAHALLALRGL